MLPQDLRKKIRWIEFSTRKLIENVLAGSYKTHFKGHGIQFSEHRLYVPGDDVRHIDWKVSARTREPYLKKYDEERELSVFLVADLSASQYFGSRSLLKSDVLAHIGGMLAYAAIKTGDQIGLLTFAGEVEKIFRPQKSPAHVQKLIRELFCFSPSKKQSGTALKEALEMTHRVMKHRGVIFILSDFIAEGYEMALKRLARKHEVVAVWIQDQKELQLPSLGPLIFLDPETQEEVWVDSRSPSFQTWFQTERQKKFQGQLERLFKQSGVEQLRLSTKDDYSDAVVQFFRSRKKKKIFMRTPFSA